MMHKIKSLLIKELKIFYLSLEDSEEFFQNNYISYYVIKNL